MIFQIKTNTIGFHFEFQNWTFIHSVFLLLKKKTFQTHFCKTTKKNQTIQIINKPYLYSRIQMIKNVIILKLAVSIVVEIDADLFTTMDTVPSQYRSRPSGDPNSSQSVSKHLVLLDQALSLLMNINASMLTMMDLVMSDNRIGIGTNLDSRQGVAVDVVVLDQAPALAEDVHATLVAVIDLVPADRRVGIRGDPNASEVV